MYHILVVKQGNVVSQSLIVSSHEQNGYSPKLWKCPSNMSKYESSIFAEMIVHDENLWCWMFHRYSILEGGRVGVGWSRLVTCTFLETRLFHWHQPRDEFLMMKVSRVQPSHPLYFLAISRLESTATWKEDKLSEECNGIHGELNSWMHGKINLNLHQIMWLTPPPSPMVLYKYGGEGNR